MGGGNDGAIGQEINGGVQLGDGFLQIVWQYQLLRFETDIKLVLCVIIRYQPGVLAGLGCLVGGRDVHSAVKGGCVHVPARVVVSTYHIGKQPDTGAMLIDQPKLFGVLKMSKITGFAIGNTHNKAHLSYPC